MAAFKPKPIKNRPLQRPTAYLTFSIFSPDATAPNPVSQRQFAAALGRALGRPAVLPVPAFALRLGLGELAELLLGGQSAPPTRLLEHGFVFRFPTLDAALADLVGTSGEAGR